MTALFIVFLALITQVCLWGIIIETPNRKESSIFEATVNILESCYMRKVKTVGIVGVSGESISKLMSLREIDLPIILIDETSRGMDKSLISPKSQHNLQIFVITVNDTGSLSKTLLQLKKCRWWNHLASFLLLHWTTSKAKCSKAYEILWETWKINLLNSKFICHDETRGQFIYTFNPYTSDAPMLWQLENTYKGFNDHIWSLFVQEYREEDNKICDKLDFDKTTNLGATKFVHLLWEWKIGGTQIQRRNQKF